MVTYEELISKIKDKLDILDVVSKEVILKKNGANFWGLCPFHKEKSPSFSVNPAKGIYKCFGCGEGGDTLSFLMKTRAQDFGEVIKDLADQFGFDMPSSHQKGANQKELKEQMIKACTKASEFYNKELLKADKSIQSVLTSRGMSEDIIKEYSLGYAPNQYKSLYETLKKDFKDEVLEKCGLILPTKTNDYVDRFRNRIIIPIKDDKGDIVAFGARAVEADQMPKYLNSSDSLIYNKSKLLYGLYYAKEAIKEEDGIIVMEGYFDVITAQANGVKNCVASCGTSLTLDHIKLISRYSKSRRIFLAFDSDAAGLKATARGAEVIKEAFMGLGNIKQFDESYASTADDRHSCEIRVIKPLEGKDPDEFIRQEGAEAYKKYVQSAPLLIDFQIEQVLKQKDMAQTPSQKAKLVKEIVPILAEIKNNIIRSEYIKLVALPLNVEENELAKEVSQALRTSSFQERRHSNLKPIVTKTSNILNKAQKNLLSLYLVSTGHFTIQQLNEMTKMVEFKDEKLTIVKSTIDKLACSVNNVRELIEQLYMTFVQDEDLKAIITDLICISEPFNNLSTKDFKGAVEESVSKIARCEREVERNEMRNIYSQIDDDTQALKIQMQLRDKINNRIQSGDN